MIWKGRPLDTLNHINNIANLRYNFYVYWSILKRQRGPNLAN